MRALCVCPLGLVSSSRDKTIKIWKELSETGFEPEATLVMFYKLHAWRNVGCAATNCDSFCGANELIANNGWLVQIGHTDYVTALAWMPAGLTEDLPEGGLVSGMGILAHLKLVGWLSLICSFTSILLHFLQSKSCYRKESLGPIELYVSACSMQAARLLTYIGCWFRSHYS